MKGLRYVIEALPRLRASRPDLHLLVIGGFTSQALPASEARAFRRELESLARYHRVADAVTFTGHLPAAEVSAALHAADAAVLPFTAGVYDPRPGLTQYQAQCSGGDNRNGFYGAGEIDAFNVVK